MQKHTLSIVAIIGWISVFATQFVFAITESEFVVRAALVVSAITGLLMLPFIAGVYLRSERNEQQNRDEEPVGDASTLHNIPGH